VLACQNLLWHIVFSFFTVFAKLADYFGQLDERAELNDASFFG
jgi:hypothetical protein